MGSSYIPNYMGDVSAMSAGGEDIGGQIAKSLSSLGSSIGHIANPQLEWHQKIRDAIAQNPEITQHLADFAYQNPDTFKQYAGVLPPDVMKLVGNTTPSFGAFKEHFARVGLSKMTDQEKTDISTARAFGTTVHGMKEEEKAGVVSTQTPEQVAPDIASQGAAKEMLGARPKEAIAQDTTAQLHGELVQNTLDYYNGMTKEQRDKVAPLGIPDLMADRHFQEEMDYRERVFAARDKDRVKDSQDRLEEADAIHMSQLTGAGDPKTWRAFRDDPQMQQRASDLASGKIVSQTPDDQKLLQVYHANQQVGQMFDDKGVNQRAKLTAGYKRDIDMYMDKLSGKGRYKNDGPPDDDVAGPLVDGLNNRFRSLASQGQPLYKATWGQEGKVLGISYGKKLHIKDSRGQEVDPSKLGEGVILDTSKLSPAAAEGYKRSGPGALNYFKQLNTPKALGYYNELLNAMQAEGMKVPEESAP